MFFYGKWRVLKETDLHSFFRQLYFLWLKDLNVVLLGNCVLIRRGALLFGGQVPEFRRNMLPPSLRQFLQYEYGCRRFAGNIGVFLKISGVASRKTVSFIFVGVRAAISHQFFYFSNFSFSLAILQDGKNRVFAGMLRLNRGSSKEWNCAYRDFQICLRPCI